MIIKIVVVVYDRFDNIRRWIKCFKYCNTKDAELVIIHNYKDEADKLKFKELCKNNDVKYVSRKNIGYDIGAFQDVCRERLVDFSNNWEYLMWFTDDVFPMSKDFIFPFLNEIKRPSVGVVCAEISAEVKIHIRTTCFIINKPTALKINFPADPVVTKTQCYEFEHRGKNTFYEQIIGLNKQIIQVSSILENAPVWDVGSRGFLKRWNEHYKEFPLSGRMGKKITFVCPVYNTFPEIVSSLINQTHNNWNLLLIHDGPNSTNLKSFIDFITDDRITYIETADRKGTWGHPLRQWAIKEMDSLSPGTDYVVVTNADNYHVPVYCEYMLQGFDNPLIVASYCSDMTHSYQKWKNMVCSLRFGHIDSAAVMVTKEASMKAGWRSMVNASDWVYFEDIIKKYGADKWAKVPGCLFVHN